MYAQDKPLLIFIIYGIAQYSLFKFIELKLQMVVAQVQNAKNSQHLALLGVQ
jgi:hypothetical protein